MLSQYKIKGSEDDWKAALSGNKTKGVISVKGLVDLLYLVYVSSLYIS